jgi:hypothetical protein
MGATSRHTQPSYVTHQEVPMCQFGLAELRTNVGIGRRCPRAWLITVAQPIAVDARRARRSPVRARNG